MDCFQVHAALREGRTDDPSVASHAAVCPLCAELVASDAELGRTLAASEAGGEASAAVLSRVAGDRHPSRMPSAARGVLTATLLVLPAFAVWAGAPRPDLHAYPLARMLLTLGLLAGSAVVVSAVVLRPVHRAAPGARSLRIAFALFVPVWLGALPQVITGHPASTPDIDLWAASWGCFLSGSVFSVGALLAVAITERRRRAPLWWHAAAVAFAAFAGALALQLTCPVTAPAHLVLGHGVIGLVWAAWFVGGIASIRAVSGRPVS
jgi:hypothetical protein